VNSSGVAQKNLNEYQFLSCLVNQSNFKKEDHFGTRVSKRLPKTVSQWENGETPPTNQDHEENGPTTTTPKAEEHFQIFLKIIQRHQYPFFLLENC
jgi:hypothetical protein